MTRHSESAEDKSDAAKTDKEKPADRTGTE